jgi:uncharacterized protein (TIGR03437 family)
MNLVFRVTALCACSALWIAAAVPQKPLIPVPKLKAYVRTGLVFEPNVGQADPEVRWISRTPDRTLLLTQDEARMVLRRKGKSSTVRMKIVGANRNAQTQGVERLSSYTNYLLGNQASKWRTGVPHYSRVKYSSVYPGVDVVYYSTDNQVEYDFVVAPGGDPSRIEMAYEGADSMRVAANGDLVLTVDGRDIRQLRPKVYQNIGGRQVEVAASYKIRAEKRVEFALAAYDRSRELVIDPILEYSAFFGAVGNDTGIGVAVDKDGAIYLGGTTTSAALLNTSGQAQPQLREQPDAFVSKSTREGRLLWTSYVGGFGQDNGRDIAVDNNTGNVYLTGTTQGINFPNVTPREEGRTDDDGFLAVLTPDGRSFIHTMLIGGPGSEVANAIAIDAMGAAYIAGVTSGGRFPTVGGFQQGPSGGGADTFVVKINVAQRQIVYATYVGASGFDSALGIAVDRQGSAYVCGYTTSANFLIDRQPAGARNQGVEDAFVYKLTPQGNDVIYGFYLGGTGLDQAYRIAVDAAGAAYLLGVTNSANFPTTSNAAQRTYGGGVADAFVAKINPAGTAAAYSTFLGGSRDDGGFGGIAVDAAGSAYVSGYTNSADFPVQSPMQPRIGGDFDGFVARISPDGTRRLYSSYFGGPAEERAYALAMGPDNRVVLAGKTASQSLPTPQIGSQTSDELGKFDAFIASISPDTTFSFLTANTGALTFAYRSGSTPEPQTITIGSLGDRLPVTVESNQPWLRVSLDQQTTPARVTVSVDPASAPAASTTALLRITSSAPAAGNSVIEIPVQVNVTLVPVITAAQPTPLTRATEAATVVLTGSGFQNGLQVRVNGLNLPTRFVNANTVELTIPGNVRSTADLLRIVVFNADGTQSTPFQLPFADTSAVSVLPSGIVNAATNLPGPIVPGEIVTIRGSGFGPDSLVAGAFVNGQLESSVGGVRVLIGGIPAPIIHAMRDQVSVVVPYGVAGRDSVDVELEWQGQQRSTPQRVVVGGASPGLFTVDGSGQGQAAVTNENGTPNSAGNAAVVGSVVTLFGTGEGMLFPSGSEGRMGANERPVQPVNVLIGGIPVTPDYAGVSPGSVVGLLQVNVRIPAGVSGTVPIVLNVGGVTSRAGVTIAVQ